MHRPYLNRPQQQDDEKLPVAALSVVGLAILSESLSSTILFPFVAFMVRDFAHLDDDRLVGQQAGLIASAFFFAQFLTSTCWGRLSDRKGRKPVMLTGLIGTSFFILCFGLSRSIPQVIVARFLCGAFNGNVDVARSVLGELATPQNQAKGFGNFGLMSGIGYMLGPALGGLLAPQHDEKGRPISLLGPTFPYLAPCLASSLYSLFAASILAVLLKETNPAILAAREAKRLLDQDSTTTSTEQSAPLRHASASPQVRDNAHTQHQDVPSYSATTQHGRRAISADQIVADGQQEGFSRNQDAQKSSTTPEDARPPASDVAEYSRSRSAALCSMLCSQLCRACHALHHVRRRLVAPELELCCLAWAFARMAHLLEGARVTVVTDHAPMGAMLTSAAGIHYGPTITRCRALLLPHLHNLRFVHRPGRLHSNADALSRLVG
ncbi:hypothetical protein CF319_g8067 [Tilletia indica]|nr:hypothetical protein CF319_g8067 [Tilletia indica]